MFSKIKPFLPVLASLLLVTLVSYSLQGFLLNNQESLVRWLASFGPYVIIVYIVLQFITIVFAPLGGFVLVIAMVALFGPGLALTLSYLVSTPTYLLNFYLARKYGGPFVEKIIGRTTLQKIDNYIESTEIFTLIVLRTFLGGNFDYISYGLGLTKVPFRSFAIVNFLAGVPGIVLYYFILRSFNNFALGLITVYTIMVILGGMPFLVGLLRRRK